MELRNRALRGALLLGTGIGLWAVATPALAQEGGLETIVITGYRASLESAINVKRQSATMVDAINAEDVAKMPDANLAESLQRIPGVSITRENGEGKQIVVRGLGSDFTRVTINGMEALATASGTLAGDSPNRSRQFDFNTFASELFNKLSVQKTPEASTDEGSLGATVSLNTGHPLDTGDKFVVSLNNAIYERGATFNPRIAGLASQTFFGGRVGVLASVAYNLRGQALDSVQNGANGFVYTVGSTNSGAFAGTPSGHTITRDGFAAPTNTICSGADGVVPGVNVTNLAYCSLLSGSDPAAYATINNPRGHDATTVTNNGIATWQAAAPTGETGAPALVHQNLYQTRIGLTSSVQWQVDDATLISVDGLFSSYYQDSRSQLLTNLGFNRNNTNTVLNAATNSTDLTKDPANPTKSSSLFSTCDAATETAVKAANSCAWAHNQLPANYYGASGAKALAFAQSIVGRPAMKLAAAQMDHGVVDYIKADNNDIRTDSDASLSTTQFSQVSLTAQHDFSKSLHWDALFGASASHQRSDGLFASMEALDIGTANGNGYYIYDIRGDGMKPKEVSFGFDVTNPAKWDLVKNYSAIRHYKFATDNKYDNISTNLRYQPVDALELKFGFQQRNYSMRTSRGMRVVGDGLNPSLSEIGINPDAIMKTVNYDASALGMGGSTPTSFAVPDLDKLNSKIGFECNCVNEYGDWRTSTKNSLGNSANITQSFGVSERDQSYYLQASLQDLDIAIGTLRGNIGLRYATTSVHSTGYTSAGYVVTATNSYDDMLPSLNLVYEPTDDMMVRFGASKVMSRPVLGNMAPGITSITLSSTANTGGSVTAGNPRLKPFRANALDVSYEWYFGKGSLISVAGFAKFLKTNPQSQTASVHLGDVLTPDMINAIAANTTDAIQLANLRDNSLFYNYTTTMDAPGGTLRGIEINFQQQFNFLPDPFDGFGINANYTVISSKIHYLFRQIGSTALTDHVGPWAGASPVSINGTLYYSASNWEARVSASYRTKYVDTWPVRSGTYAVGYGNSWANTDFVYGKSSMYIDASASYSLSDNLSFKVDALNLTNQHTMKYWLFQNQTERETYDSISGRQFFMGVTYKY